MQIPSLISANYVAREIGYRMPEGWGQGDRASNAFFSPLETYRERFASLLSEVRGLGFAAVDLWTAHLNPVWATDEHVKIACEMLARHGLTVPSLAGGFGDTPALFERSCEVATAVGARVLAGNAKLFSTDRAATLAILRDRPVKLALENHPEKSPAEMLSRLGDPADGRVGIALDTGWFATQGFAPATAIRALRPHLLAVHLKDVKARRAEKTGYPMTDMGHETCALGEGIADIPACVAALKETGFQGPVGIEHEPEHFCPNDDLRLSLARFRTWAGA